MRTNLKTKSSGEAEIMQYDISVIPNDFNVTTIKSRCCYLSQAFLRPL